MWVYIKDFDANGMPTADYVEFDAKLEWSSLASGYILKFQHEEDALAFVLKYADIVIATLNPMEEITV